MRYVLDTNIWIHFLRKRQHVRQRLQQALRNRDEICVIPIVYYELLRGLEKRHDTESLAFIKRFWRTLSYYEATRQIWDEAIRLWVTTVRQNQKREDADILIAAFASHLQATVVTTNVKHFSVFDLRVENWMEETNP